QVRWYHEIDFGNGLKSRSPAAKLESRRRVWGFNEQQLDAVDFRGKEVLDIGCWDGYWSFYAERNGAKHVLATDDVSQRWSVGNGLLVAKEILQSGIETRQDLSIYRLDSLGRKFDVIMCFGVYYHL